MKKFKLFLALTVFAMFMTSCDSLSYTMREPNNHVEFVASDFEFSEPVTGTATVTRIVFIDWDHMFGTAKVGSTGTGVELPIIGNLTVSDAKYALYDIMEKNPGYDVIFYPKVKEERHAPILGTGLFSVSTYTVTARLGKLKK